MVRLRGLGLPAYAEDGVDAAAALPYITVQLISPIWRATTTFYARIWYRSRSTVEINAKADEIGAAIGEGVSIPTARGAVIITKADNFAQHMRFEGDEALKCVYLSMYLQAITG